MLLRDVFLKIVKMWVSPLVHDAIQLMNSNNNNNINNNNINNNNNNNRSFLKRRVSGRQSQALHITYILIKNKTSANAI